MMNATSTLEFVVLPAGTSTPAHVVLEMDSANSINAVEATIAIPQGLTVTSISDAGSLVSFWIKPPHYDAASHTIFFAGITPGGWRGQSQLMQFSVTPEHAGTITISNAEAFLNGPDATPVTLLLGTAQIVPAPIPTPIPKARLHLLLPYLVLVILGVAVWHRRRMRRKKLLKR